MASDPKIQKTIRRCQQRVQEGQFYEAHQQLRVIAARYVKQKDFVSATEVLHGGAGELLRGGQGGSAGDLCFYLVTILRDGQIRIDDNLRTKLIGLLNLFSSEEPSLKKYTDELLKWSSQFSDSPCGDPEVQLAVGRSLVGE